MAHKKKQKEDPPTDTSSPSSEKEEEVENPVSEAEEEEEEVESSASEKSDSDSDFVESSKNHKRRRNNAVKKPNSSSSSSKAKSTKIIIKKRVSYAVERKWSDEDEIVVLEGMRDWKNKGWFPNIALDEFIDEFRKSLHISIVSKLQMGDKIKRLKERFCKFLEKKSDYGVEPVFEDPHDYKMYLIMKDIWGDEHPVIRRNVPVLRKRNLKVGDGDGDGNGNGNGRIVKAKRELLDNLPRPGFKECVSKEGLKLIGDSKVMEFERKWKRLLKEERDLNSKRMELIQETTQTFLAAVESSKD